MDDAKRRLDDQKFGVVSESDRTAASKSAGPSPVRSSLCVSTDAPTKLTCRSLRSARTGRARFPRPRRSLLRLGPYDDQQRISTAQQRLPLPTSLSASRPVLIRNRSDEQGARGREHPDQGGALLG